MDSAIDNAFYVFNPDGSYIRFKPTDNGMYVIEVENVGKQNVTLAHQTVKENKSKYSDLDYKRAVKIRELQESLGFPSDKDLAHAIEYNVLGNTPFTRRDVRIAKEIFGPSIAAIKGKSVLRTSKIQREDTKCFLSPSILKEYQEVFLAMDVVYVNKIPFLLFTSKHIGYTQVKHVMNKNRDGYLEIILDAISEYSKSGFTVKVIEADGAFKVIEEDLKKDPYKIDMHFCNPGGHVEVIERQIRFVKDRIRSVRALMPFKKVPSAFMIEMVIRVVQLTASMPNQNGIHQVLSP